MNSLSLQFIDRIRSWLISKIPSRFRGRLSLLFILLLAGMIAFWRALPDPLFDSPVSTVLLDRNGTLLGAKIAADEQWRFPLRQDVSEKFRTALIHFEDKRFLSHPGVDPLALARALYLNLTQGRIVSGGSTISMQVIRLARQNPDRTLWEKMLEAILALRLELAYSKHEILAFYSAHAPFGGNVVGLEAAAWRYFGRAPERLSWAETCTLAVLPNSPALIHPGRNRERLKTKRDALLKRLYDAGVLDELSLQLALREPLPQKPVALPRLAPHLMDSLASGIRHQQHQDHRLVSTLDAGTQSSVNDAVTAHARALELRDVHNVAVLVLDNQTLQARAYVGNSRYDINSGHGYAVDIVRRRRSTGSILKPMLYAAMLQSGEILPDMLVADIPTQYAGYMPENFDHQYRGAVKAKQALARSLNVPAVRLLKQYGVGRFYDQLQNMGMSTLHRRPDDYGLTLILGGAEGSLWELTGVYANLARFARHRGSRHELRYLNPVVKMAMVNNSHRSADIGPGAAWLTLKALLEVKRPGDEKFWRRFNNSQRIGWKTGTSHGHRDAWAIGVTPKYTVGVWVGNASGEGREGLTGVSAAAPLLFDIFNRINDDSGWFAPPLQDLKTIQVCDRDGFLATAYCESQIQQVPRESHFDRVSPYHQRVHLDAAGRWRVHGRCEPVRDMRHQNWFSLPSAQAWYFQKHNAAYKPMPPWRKDCQALTARQASSEGSENTSPIEILYPGPGTRLYIPIDLDSERSKTVFEAVHRNSNEKLFWHLDEDYLGDTTTFHQQALLVAPGRHKLTLVDSHGNMVERWFEVLGKE